MSEEGERGLEEENTELVGRREKKEEEVSGDRDSYFAFFCVSSWNSPHPPPCYPRIVILSLETNARDFKCTCLLHIPFIKTHMPSVERVGTRAEVLESEIGSRTRGTKKKKRQRRTRKKSLEEVERECIASNDMKRILNSKHRPHYREKISTLRLHDLMRMESWTARKLKEGGTRTANSRDSFVYGHAGINLLLSGTLGFNIT